MCQVNHRYSINPVISQYTHLIHTACRIRTYILPIIKYSRQKDTQTARQNGQTIYRLKEQQLYI